MDGPDSLRTDRIEPNPEGGLFSLVKKGLFLGAEDSDSWLFIMESSGSKTP